MVNQQLCHQELKNERTMQHSSYSKGFYLCAPMEIEIVKSKIHRVRITEADINYVGSITIDEDLMDAANLIENEKVQVVNINNGERLETYVIKGKRDTGTICLNGPAARKGVVGDIVIVISYAHIDFEEAKKFMPSFIFPDENNRLKK
jgi:aspartate 1-decarboxylase